MAESIVSKRMDAIESSGIRRIFELAKSLRDPVNLGIGEPDFDVPEALKNSVIDAVKEKCGKYTASAGDKELIRKVEAKLAKDNGIRQGKTMITAGVSGGLFLAFNTLLDPGDEIIIPDPYFVVYKQIANFIGAKPLYAPIDLDFDELSRKVSSRTKAIIINSPNNPTGKVYGRSVMEKAADFANEHDLIVISDEIYEKFIFDKEHFSIGSIYDKTITLNGLSKSHAIPGWRLGYANGPDEVIDAMTKLQQYTFVCAPTIAQKACIHSFDIDISRHINDYKKKRDLIYKGLKENFEVEKPDGAFYIYPKAPNGNGMEFVEEAIKNNVLIVPGNVFSESNTHFRISFAASDETIRKGIDILNRIGRN